MADDGGQKRRVSYNQAAVLCPVCTKRMRLNNSGRIRVHLAGGWGSEHCPGSNTEITPYTYTGSVPPNVAAEWDNPDDAVYDEVTPLFSDAE